MGIRNPLPFMRRAPTPAPAPRRLYPLRPHALQQEVITCGTRFIVLPCGRRSGKTELAKRKLIVESLAAYGWDDPAFFAGAPTRDQAKSIYWNDLKAMSPPSLVTNISESQLCITFINGTELRVVGMDKPQRIEGRPWNGGVLDEFADMKPGAWGENVRPALSDRKGWCWLIGVPEGRNHYYDLYKYALSGVDPDWRGFTWKSIEILDPAEVEAARRQLDPLVFEQEYEASFVNFVGRIYYPFQEDTHARVPLKYDPRRPIGFCFDFNVDPGVCAIVQEQTLPGQFERDSRGIPLLDKPLVGTGVIGEVWIPLNSNTVAVCRKLVKEWGAHEGEVVCYGDATGGARGSAKVQGSDWDLIKATLVNPGEDMKGFSRDRLSFKVRTSNPAERARINAVNTRLKNGVGEIRLLVDPAKAPHVVKDLEGVRALEGGSGEIDKKIDPKMTHISDALGYYVEREYPIAGGGAAVTRLRA